MINFVGIKYNKLICLLIMRNEKGQEVEIPINRDVAGLISAHIARLSETKQLIVERAGDDSLD